MGYFMKRLVLVAASVAVLAGCAVPGRLPSLDKAVGSSGLINAPALEFVSIDPGASLWFEKETSAGLKKVFWEDLTNAQANPELSLERSFVSIKKIETSGAVSVASAKFTAEAGKYKTIIDYAKYRDDVISPGDVPCKVGVGVRISADVVTTKADIDLGSLFAIAFAAKSGYLSGQIEVLKIGIDSPSLSLILPPPSEINDTSLQNALQAVAGIRAKLYDADTKIRPHILAVKYQNK